MLLNWYENYERRGFAMFACKPDGYENAKMKIDKFWNFGHSEWPLLAIPELNAIQWVLDASKEQVLPWIEVFKKNKANKSAIAYPSSQKEIEALMENLPARGLYLQMWVADEDEA